MNPTTISIGIDLSLKKNQVVGVDHDGKQITSFVVDNDLPGATKLVEKIITLATNHHATTIKIGMEATNMYWWHLHQFLVQNEILNRDLSVDVFTLNPKLVKKFHDAQED